MSKAAYFSNLGDALIAFTKNEVKNLKTGLVPSESAKKIFNNNNALGYYDPLVVANRVANAVKAI